jgi:hypothetical protein
MIKGMIEKLCLRLDNRPKFDPARFNDPLALQTEWIPAKGGGANFCTHKLAQVGMGRVEFHASMGAKLFCLVFLLAGLAIAVGIPALEFSKGALRLGVELLFPLLFGLVFAAIGGAMFYFWTKPIVFDRKRGFYWKGRKAPSEMYDRAALKDCARLEDIHALQLVSEYCHGNKSSYYSYELNLVLNDGRRLNVVDHGSRDKLRADTTTLARFLDKPVWDAL